MTTVTVFQFLSCLMLYATSAQAIMVKYGTNPGPIVAPSPTTVLPPMRPYRNPAPVWEETTDDTPNPNAQWRPQPYVPQPRYTQINYNTETSSPPRVSNVQQFVNSYRPKNQPIQAAPIKNFFTPTQMLSSQSLPGIGIRYFIPAYINKSNEKDHSKHSEVNSNDIETNEIPDDKYSASDKAWLVEKEVTKRSVVKEIRNHAFQWPERISERHQ